MKKFHRRYAIIGIWCLSLLTGITTFFILNPSSISLGQLRFFASPTPTLMPTPTYFYAPPTAINIPTIHKNLPIMPATVKGNSWDLFDDAVAWLSTSAVPGKGNVILYAHDWKNLWADLYLLKKGDPIDVQQGSVWVRYIVTESRAVDQHDIQSILSDKDRLTLYTCEGNFDLKRRVVYAERI